MSYGHQGTAVAPAPVLMLTPIPGYQHIQGQWAQPYTYSTATAVGTPGVRNIPRRSSNVPTSSSAAPRHQAQEDPAALQDVTEEMLLEEAHRLFGVSWDAVGVTEDGSSSGPTVPDPAGTSEEGSAVATAPSVLLTATHDHQDSEGLSPEISSTATPMWTPSGSNNPLGTDVPPSPSAGPSIQELGDLGASLGISDEELMEEALQLLGCPPAMGQLCQTGASSSPMSGDTGDTQGCETLVAPASPLLPTSVTTYGHEGPLRPLNVCSTATTMGTLPGSTSPLGSTSPPSTSAAPHHTAPGDTVGHGAAVQEVLATVSSVTVRAGTGHGCADSTSLTLVIITGQWLILEISCASCLVTEIHILIYCVLIMFSALSQYEAGRAGARAAVVLGCPDDWVGYRNVCYYLSSMEQEGSWEWSQEQCSLLGASLAVLEREWETEFLSRLRGNIDYWLGLRRRDGRLQWVNGSTFNHTTHITSLPLDLCPIQAESPAQRENPAHQSRVQAAVLATGSSVTVRAGTGQGCADSTSLTLVIITGQWLILEISCASCLVTEIHTLIYCVLIMFSVLSQYKGNSCGQKTTSGPGWKSFLPVQIMPCVEDSTTYKERGSPSRLPVGQGEKNRFCDTDGNVDEPLGPQCGWVSRHPELPGQTDKGTGRGRVAGRAGARVTVVLGCPEDWVGYRNVCYYLSSMEQEGSWEWSQEQCSLLGASLAVLEREWEMEFLSRLRGNIDYWLGLRRRDGRLQWVNGSSFNHTYLVYDQGECERCVPRGVWLLVLVLLLVLLLAAVLSAGRAGARVTVVLGCPDDWVGYRNVCYYLSSMEQEGSWEWSQERCSLLGASLAVLEREWEMEFLSRLRGNIDYWLGLRRRDGQLQWVNGSSFNHTTHITSLPLDLCPIQAESPAQRENPAHQSRVQAAVLATGSSVTVRAGTGQGCADSTSLTLVIITGQWLILEISCASCLVTEIHILIYCVLIMFSVLSQYKGERCVPHGVWLLVLVLLLVLLLAAVLSAGRAGARAAVVLGCPDDWVGYRNVCYYLSSTEQEGSWEWSQEQCSLLGASLAVLEREWEMEFLSRLRGNIDYWLGLRRRDGRLQWVNGSSFNHTYLVYDQGECAFFSDRGVMISNCSRSRPYLCSKPPAII
ncbi:hypothetical protein Q9233_000480 [Columba guinea]|nr:hypothetical protein Q9233_000480 [Columba guinea]